MFEEAMFYCLVFAIVLPVIAVLGVLFDKFGEHIENAANKEKENE